MPGCPSHCPVLSSMPEGFRVAAGRKGRSSSGHMKRGIHLSASSPVSHCHACPPPPEGRSSIGFSGGPCHCLPAPIFPVCSHHHMPHATAQSIYGSSFSLVGVCIYIVGGFTGPGMSAGRVAGSAAREADGGRGHVGHLGLF